MRGDKPKTPRGSSGAALLGESGTDGGSQPDLGGLRASAAGGSGGDAGPAGLGNGHSDWEGEPAARADDSTAAVDPWTSPVTSRDVRSASINALDDDEDAFGFAFCLSDDWADGTVIPVETVQHATIHKLDRMASDDLLKSLTLLQAEAIADGAPDDDEQGVSDCTESPSPRSSDGGATPQRGRDQPATMPTSSAAPLSPESPTQGGAMLSRSPSPPPPLPPSATPAADSLSPQRRGSFTFVKRPESHFKQKLDDYKRLKNELTVLAEMLCMGIPIGSYDFAGKMHHRCFRGVHAVTWLMSNGFADDITTAMLIGNRMVFSGLFYPVTGNYLMENGPLLFRFSEKIDPDAARARTMSGQQLVCPSFEHLFSSAAGLSCIKNFRCLSMASSAVMSGRIFRSATPAGADEDDINLLVNELLVRTIIDLRQKKEALDDEGEQLLMGYCYEAEKAHKKAIDGLCDPDFLDSEELESSSEQGIRRYISVEAPADAPPGSPLARPLSRKERRELSPSPSRAASARPKSSPRLRSSRRERRRLSNVPSEKRVEPMQSPTATGGTNESFVDGQNITLFRAPLAPRSTMARVLWSMTPRADKRKVVGSFLRGKKRDAKKRMLAVMNELGLLGLNKIILENSGKQLCRILKIMADRQNHPVLVHCSHGKDRTGLVALLVLMIAGATPDEIVADYVKSQASARTEAGMARMRQINPDLDIDAFTQAPPEVAHGTMLFIHEELGGLSNYLDSIGFDHSWRTRLQAAICGE